MGFDSYLSILEDKTMSKYSNTLILYGIPWYCGL
jgi:hypothetical protein